MNLDRDSLMTLPIECYTEATFVSIPERNAITVEPANKRKSQQIASLITVARASESCPR